jgi:transcriptional regulator with XRE-family HTH domain
MSELAVRIATMRERTGLSLREFADKSGINHSMLWRYERGTTIPRATQLARVAKGLGCSVAFLMGETPSRQRPSSWTREFVLQRDTDHSGVSGTGIVAVGVQLPSGRCILEWLPGELAVRSIGIYRDIAEVKAVHGHNGATKVVYEAKA